MKAGPKKDIVASIRARLLKLAKTRGEDLDLVLKRFGIERLLYRLSRSEHQEAYVLKGAMLFELWMGRRHRTTKDLDLLGFGSPEIPRLESVFRELCQVQSDSDGLEFLPESVSGTEIREGSLYQGIRISLQARLGVARITIQVDIGFGDAVFPSPDFVDYPSLLDLPQPRLRAYPKECVLAEKFHAMVELGMANSRLKDYLDIWTILKSFEVDPDTLHQSIQETFGRRGTQVPEVLPQALSMEFANDLIKQTQWKAVIRKAEIPGDIDLRTVVMDLEKVLCPLFWGR